MEECHFQYSRRLWLVSKGNLNRLFDKVLQMQKHAVEGKKSVSLANLRFQVTNINPL